MKKEEPPKQQAYDRDAEKNQEIGDEFLNPDENMENAALKIQTVFKGNKDRKRVKEMKEAKNAEAGEGAGQDGAYDREAEKNQEIGDEFLNPDENMEEAALKIPTVFKGNKDRKRVKEMKEAKAAEAQAQEEPAQEEPAQEEAE